MKLRPIYFILLFLLIVSAFFVWQRTIGSDSQEVQEFVNSEEVQQSDRVVEIKITPRDTYGKLMAIAEVEPETSAKIFEASKDVYDLSKIRADRSLFLYYDIETDELKQLVYQIDSEEELYVIKDQSKTSTSSEEVLEIWKAERLLIDYEIKIKTVEGTLETSLYQFALDNDVDVRAIIELADDYQWTIDFAMDPRVGDTFKFIYEERFRDGEYKMPGKVLAANYVNEGASYKIFYFAEDEENKGYFDQQGNSVQKILLKAPIQYKYITSGFTTGLRCLSSYKLCTNHRAIDYAAPVGTPIRAVGDGTVISAGWNSGGYGYLTTIRHNDTYTTNYAHQSSILVKYGQKVKQGDVIGKVGSTGLSTGPHLHYEIVEHGVKINPLELELPPGKAIKEENLERFYRSIEQYTL